MSQGEEKTESPTDFKLKQARQKGQVAKSADAVTWLGLAMALVLLAGLAPQMMKKMAHFFNQLHLDDHENLSKGMLIDKLAEGSWLWLVLSLPVLAVAALGAILGNVGQFGFLLTSHPLKPDLKRINPIAGLKKIFSKDRAVELIKQLVKFTAIFLVLYQTLKDSLSQVSLLFRVELAAGLMLMTGVLWDIVIRVLVCFLAIALFDMLWQRYSFMKSMRMSKYEVKKEYKQQEGDPHIKQERKRMHQELQEATATNKISEAAVVITNPSHVAVAIKYQDGADQVPIMIAKGVGRLAKDLTQEAARWSVPVIRNVPLAHDLQWLNINEEIPEHLYDSVAEVLIFIHELNAKYGAAQHEN